MKDTGRITIMRDTTERVNQPQHLSNDTILPPSEPPMQILESPVPPLLLTIPQVALALNLSRAKIYRLIQNRELPVVRIGRAVRVSWTSLQHWVSLQEQERGSDDGGLKPSHLSPIAPPLQPEHRRAPRQKH